MTIESAPTVYIETTIVSYLTARPTDDLLAAAWRKATSDWWNTDRHSFDVYTSDVAIGEAARGNPQAAARRLDALFGIAVLPMTQAVLELSAALLRGQALPPRAHNDAVHIAISAVHGLEYLLTWNFRHIANAQTRPMIRGVCAQNGYTSPEICTPIELMGGSRDA